MMGNGSAAGPLTPGMEEKNVVRVTGNDEPSEKQLMHSQPIRQYFVVNCFDSVGALTRGEYGGRNGGVWRVNKWSRLKVRLMAGLSCVIY